MSGDCMGSSEAVNCAFLEYYYSLLGETNALVTLVNYMEVVREGTIFIRAHKDMLSRPFTSDEVKNVMFSMDGNRMGFRVSILKIHGIL